MLIRNPRLLMLSIVIVLIGGGVFFLFRDDAPEVSEARLAQEALIGPTEATVQIIEYGAYGCTTCRSVRDSGVIERILEIYGEDVNFVFRNWPIRNPTVDPLSAQAAQCALDQSDEAFWRLHNALFDLSVSDYNQLTDESDYVTLATQLEINAQAIQTCLAEDVHERTVRHWDDEAKGRNMPGTPTLFVNNQRVNDVNQLENTVRRALGLS